MEWDLAQMNGGPPWSVNNEMGYSEHQELDFMCCPNMKPSNMPWEDRVLQWQLETRVHILASWEPHQSLSFLWYISPQDLEQQLKKSSPLTPEQKLQRAENQLTNISVENAAKRSNQA